MQTVHFYRLIRFIVVIAVIFSVGFLAIYLSRYTYPFIFAFLLAFLMNPLVNFLQHNAKMPRPLAVFITILLILAFIIGIITILVVEIINGTTHLAKEVPKYFEELVNYFQEIIAAQVIPIYERLSSIISSLDPSQQTQVMEQIRNIGASITATGQEVLKNILTWIPEQIAGIPNFATVIIFSLLGTFFISKDWYKLVDAYKKITPNKVASSSSTVIKGLQSALLGFVKAQLTLISITAVIVLIGLLILRVDYAITLALIIGAVDLLPYLGTGLVFVPWILYMFFTGNYFLTIGLSILYIIVIVQRQLMEPKVLSTNIGLDPLATLIALFAGYKLFGFLGLIIGPVILVVLNTLYRTGVIKEIWDYIKGKSD
ncbi:sporulation integral membrane protein YtvI [Salirhabdus euzebyi]|uniref:Sporulation integral membrane protein YtvI n=1 Tax=Salirhabdus euzebyi TaxID=394506 RepID=A0A841PXC8_9BACI|nr:sporulation integral membrane protein YtvI [Salirhabdus euzebyi]MBB6452086.1 sporulation integral membrane protein YtvI [Salirhabdus euzebyi]